MHYHIVIYLATYYAFMYTWSQYILVFFLISSANFFSFQKLALRFLLRNVNVFLFSIHYFPILPAQCFLLLIQFYHTYMLKLLSHLFPSCILMSECLHVCYLYSHNLDVKHIHFIKVLECLQYFILGLLFQIDFLQDIFNILVSK